METRRLDELCVQITDCPHSTPQWLSSGKLVLRNFNIHNGRIDLSNVSYTDDETFFARNKRATPIPGDIVMSREAPMGEVAIIPNGFECCLGQRMVLLHPDATVCNGKFLMYSLLSPFVQKQIKRSDTTGSVVSNLCIPDLCALEIPYVNIERQECIVALLSDIDSKIDNNNAIAAELEGMAKDLYDYWFVQFDFPDENGKPYKSSGGKMVWNEELKREIPEGWEVSQLKDICFLRNGINYDKNEVGDADFKIANVRNITASTFLMDVNDFDVIHLKKEKAKQYSLKPEDIVIARSGTPGAIRLVQNPKNDTIFCGFIICCTPKVAKYRNYMAYTLKLFEGTSATKTGGSILQNVSQDTLNSLILCIPPDELIEKFNIMITSILEEIQNTINESRELTSLRDFLLPMLMNGQVKVKGA